MNYTTLLKIMPSAKDLIAVGLRLVGSIDGDSNILRLLSSQNRELGAQALEVEPRDLLVESLGKDVNLSGRVLARVLLGPELDLGEGLVGEGAAHDERRVSRSAAKVEQSALGKDNNAVARLEDESVNLGLDVDPLRDRHESSHVDLVIEVADVTDDGVVLHLAHGIGHENSLVSGRGDEDVGLAHDVLEGANSVALHAGLESADGVDLGNVNNTAVGAHGSGAPLSDISVSADDGLLAGHHNIRGAHDTIRERVLAPVKVVELRLGDRVVDIDGREEEGSLLLHGVQPVHSRGSLLGDSLAPSSDLVPLISLAGLEKALDDRKDDLELLVVRGRRVGEGSVLKEGILGLLTLVDKQSHITAIVDDDVGSVTLAVVLGPGDGAQGALPVLLESLSLPCENGGALVTGDSGSGVVLYNDGE